MKMVIKTPTKVGGEKESEEKEFPEDRTIEG